MAQRRYKVMLVDDEPIIRDGLRSCIRWEDHGFELTGDYADGCEAQEAIEQSAIRPDLTITDVNMPLMDGLKLAERIRRTDPLIKIVMLTGYDEFEYAQQAIRLKVSDFILKPVTAREIRKLLDTVRSEMDAEQRQREAIGQLNSRVSESLPLLKERFFESALTAGLTMEAFRAGLAEFGLAPAPAPLRVVVLRSDHTLTSSHQLLTQQAAEEGYGLEGLLSPLLVGMVGRERELILILTDNRNRPNDDRDLRFTSLEERIEQVCSELRQRFGCRFAGGISRACLSSEQLPEAYQSALSVMKYTFLFGQEAVLCAEQLVEPGAGEPSTGKVSASNPGWEKEIAALFVDGAFTEGRARLTERTEEMKIALLSPHACHLHVERIGLYVRQLLIESGTDAGDALAEEMAQLESSATLDVLAERFASLLESHLTSCERSRCASQEAQMSAAVAYIEHHYHQAGITLQEVCSHVWMSTSRFSQAFKQHTGETFVEYLTRIRMSKAKELLQYTVYRSYQIAEKVGYTDPNYFSLSFKKHTGVTPKQYRDDHREPKELSS